MNNQFLPHLTGRTSSTINHRTYVKAKGQSRSAYEVNQMAEGENPSGIMQRDGTYKQPVRQAKS